MLSVLAKHLGWNFEARSFAEYGSDGDEDNRRPVAITIAQ